MTAPSLAEDIAAALAEHRMVVEGRIYDKCRCGWYGSFHEPHVSQHLEDVVRVHVDNKVAEARAEGILRAVNQIQRLYDLQCPVGPRSQYVDKGAMWAHQWWETCLGGELDRLREDAARPPASPAPVSTDTPNPCAPPKCSCMGHRMPGVHHLVPCCGEPHVTDTPGHHTDGDE